jgi:hypothetical protein
MSVAHGIYPLRYVSDVLGNLRLNVLHGDEASDIRTAVAEY